MQVVSSGKYKRSVVFLLLLFVFLLPITTLAQSSDEGSYIISVPNGLVDRATLNDALYEAGKIVATTETSGEQTALVEGRVMFASTLSGDPVTTPDPCTLLAEHGIPTRYCEPNYLVSVEAVPSDPMIGTQWGLGDAHAAEAWNISQGSSDTVVAILDTGVDANHEDLRENLWTNPAETPGDGIDNDQNGYIDDIHGVNTVLNNSAMQDDHGHGTHVAGIIGATGNNGIGVSGVSWHTKILPLKFLSSTGTGSMFSAIQAINYVIGLKQRGVNIVAVNASWGGPAFSAALQDAVQALGAAGVLLVASAGNAARDNDVEPNYPASFNLDNVISVAAIDTDGNLGTFSNYGATSVDIAAPGMSILSTVPSNRYTLLSGTSMAAPFVSGAAALLRAAHPEYSLAETRSAILQSGSSPPSLRGIIATGSKLNLYRLLSGMRTIEMIEGGKQPELPASKVSLFVSKRTISAGRYLTIQISAPTDLPVTLSIGGSDAFHCNLPSLSLAYGDTTIAIRATRFLGDYLKITAATPGSARSVKRVRISTPSYLRTSSASHRTIARHSLTKWCRNTKLRVMTTQAASDSEDKEV